MTTATDLVTENIFRSRSSLGLPQRLHEVALSALALSEAELRLEVLTPIRVELGHDHLPGGLDYLTDVAGAVVDAEARLGIAMEGLKGTLRRQSRGSGRGS